jgi:hypothetical protein
MQSRTRRVLNAGLMVAVTAGAFVLVYRPLQHKSDAPAGGRPSNVEAARAERLAQQMCDGMQITTAERARVLEIMIARGRAMDESMRQARAAGGFVLERDDAGRLTPPPYKVQDDQARAQIVALLGPERGKDFLERYLRAEMDERSP